MFIARRAAATFGLFVLAADLAPPACTQEFRFRQLTPDNGLSSSFVQIVFQDAQGFLWFGTDKGLDRYDGYSVRNYRHQRGDPHTLADGTINSIYQDRGGTIWIGTNMGLSWYDLDHDAFTNYQIGTSASSVHSIVEDSQRTLSVGAGHGLYIFDRANGSAEPLSGAAGNLLTGLNVRPCMRTGASRSGLRPRRVGYLRSTR